MGALGVVRDVAIVLLAVESIVIGVLLALMLVQIRALVKMVKEEVEPMLDSANETTRQVKGTVGIVSETIVNPLVSVRSWVAGARQMVDALMFFKSHKNPVDTGASDSTEGGTSLPLGGE